jgi:hypothetical protein
MFFEDAGVLGNEEREKSETERRVAHADLLELLSIGRGRQQALEQ